MEMQMLLLLLASTVPVVLSERDFDYCEIRSCNPYSHVFCKYRTPAVSKKCGDVVRSSLTPEEKEMILDLHNHFRWLVYTEQEERGLNGPQPASENMTFLKWDPELEEIAQRWSVQCQRGYAECSDVACMPDECLEEYSVNQLYGSDKNNQNMEDLSIETILWNWYSEVIHFDSAEVKCFKESTAYFWHTYHYSQIVWGKTTKIGCNAIRYADSKYFRLKLVCNYAPGGNIEGEPIYKT